MTLGGFVAIRNGDRLDYCWREAVKSLLPVCDEVVICDSDSDDGTREAMNEWEHREPKITLANFKWTNPTGTNQWWLDFLNYSRQHLSTDWCIGLDGDEVLHEACYHELLEAVRLGKSLYCHRLNFWRDTEHLIPHGKCCGYWVIRVGPQNLWMPSDYPEPRAAKLISLAQPSGVMIYHYGFLRQRDAFFRKAREVQRIWTNSYDPRLEAVEKKPGNWMADESICEWVNDLLPFNGTHPKCAEQWLRERGFNPKM